MISRLDAQSPAGGVNPSVLKMLFGFMVLLGTGVANAEPELVSSDSAEQHALEMSSPGAPPSQPPETPAAPKDTPSPPDAPAVPPPAEEKRKRDPSKSINIEQEMLIKRRVFLTEPIDDKIAKRICMELMFLDAEDPGAKIMLFINSPGGTVTAGLAIYDTMQAISSPVHTVCFGKASSMAALILSAGEPGHRIALPNSRAMVHQPSLGMPKLAATDVFIHAEETRRLKGLLNRIIARHTKQKPEVVEAALERDKHMSAEEARQFGLVDRVSTTFDTEDPAPKSKL